MPKTPRPRQKTQLDQRLRSCLLAELLVIFLQRTIEFYSFIEICHERKSKLKLNKETLWHFTCDHCHLWWSFASSDNYVPKRQIFCPHCGVKNEIEPFETTEDKGNL